MLYVQGFQSNPLLPKCCHCVLQMSYKALLYYPESKQHWQGGTCHFIAAAVGAPATSTDKVSSKQRGSAGRETFQGRGWKGRDGLRGVGTGGGHLHRILTPGLESPTMK